MTYLGIPVNSDDPSVYGGLKLNPRQDLRGKLSFGAKQGWMKASVLAAVLDSADLPIDGVVTLLRKFRLPIRQVRRPNAFIPLSNSVLFMEALAEHVSDPTLGASIGSKIRPIDFGPIGVLMCVTPTVRTGLQLLSRYRDALQSSTNAFLNDYGDYGVLVYQLEADVALPSVQWCELVLAAICSLLRTRLGREWSPLEIHFRHAPGKRGHVLEQIFHTPLFFNRTVTKLVISSSDLDRRLRSADNALLATLEEHVAYSVEKHNFSSAGVLSNSS